ncbi:PIN domain-containing protein [Novosphingobium sp. JCM 18896]|uniref:PIN domain-containing protein n=1 Tax=Novosphingobium sp. JCM 18896 TaxID=2989731 RepID=UPI00222315E3|nr:PIN domain-containing protein [Novosphingobium sp. JCM 18896]MCW1427988.1 PIN domain-containing protein [Novosphingobium sp. JCM 18896]
MSGFTFDANVVIDALTGFEPARSEIRRAAGLGPRVWMSRMVWMEVMSKGSDTMVRDAEAFLSGFGIDEIDAEIGTRAAALRRERPQLNTPNAIVLATALIRGRVLVTRNVKDFPAQMPGVRVPYFL